MGSLQNPRNEDMDMSNMKQSRNASLYEEAIERIDISEVDKAMLRARLERVEFISNCLASGYRALTRLIGAPFKGRRKPLTASAAN